MSTARIFLIGSLCVFGAIGVAAWVKKKPALSQATPPQVVEIPLAPPPVAPAPIAPAAKPVAPKPALKPVAVAPKPVTPPPADETIPDVDRIGQLFALDSSKLPVVETVSYTSRVPWLKGRPAWIADYASYYGTSRHFIARSLNRKADYFTQKISPGDRFNVFRKDKNLNFHLLIDLSRSRMWFYYIDLDTNERVLLKTYRVGVGRQDNARASGYLTPVGKYMLGEKVAIYKSGTMGFFQDQKTEMVRIFGTRWIPFDKEVEACSEPAKGYGLHGAPWVNDSASNELVEDRSKLGKYDSDGCIRLASEDIEELFAIVLTKPTTVELVKDYREAKLPGIEKESVK
ncbi:MAG: L,D-transpeptidase [Verrucomicrobiota bacterium]|nr:L,D-transpeptidase [Verrucomicrobiota bacterium]